MPFNSGVGISGGRGDEVRAVFNGTVKQIVLVPGYNQCVLVQHGSYYTFYCKLSAVKVKIDDQVTTGDVLGTLAEIDGAYTLHFELWKGGTERLNPELWLRKR
jgi:murein DD-endopeptidase MepM/ murein hydrolase activator NlpD